MIRESSKLYWKIQSVLLLLQDRLNYMFSLIHLCGDCWSIQPLLRKLQVEYERYFTLRIVLRTSLPTMNPKCTRKVEDASLVKKRMRLFLLSLSKQLNSKENGQVSVFYAKCLNIHF